MRLTMTFCLPFLLLLLLVQQLETALAAEDVLFSVPTVIDDDSVGQLGFAGNYAGISNVKSSLQFESNSDSSALVLRRNGSVYERISNFQGNITSSCKFNNSVYYFGGEFETVNQTTNSVHHIVQFNTETNQFLPLLQGLNGPVYSLYCDQQDEILYIGGNFSLSIENNTANNAISYSLKNNSSSWSILPWKGFNGPVYSITKNKKLNTILFGGKFDSTLDGQYFNSNTSQIISMSSPTTTISSGNGALMGANSDPNSIVCPNKVSPESTTGQPWYLQDGVPGYWDANFANPVQPTVFRLSNTQTDRGAISLNILALGSNEYFNLSYIDPVTHQAVQCSESCILSNGTYQDFTVVDSLSTSGVRINIESWFGAGGGLGYVQIFQSDISVHPLLTSNTNAQCNPTGSSTTTTITGNWKDVYVFGYYQTVLVADVPYSELSTSNTDIVYQPNIPSQGQYDIYATTPGCVGSSNCFTRTQVEYQLQLSPGFPIITVYSDQNVYTDNRFLLYSGFISPVSSNFKPTITLRPAANATQPINGGSNVQIMADTIEFVRNTTAASLVSILEYSPTNATMNSTAISWKPLNQQLPIESTVYTIDASNGDTLYIGGSFATSNSTNVIAYNNQLGQFMPLAASGLNGKVSTLLLSNSNLLYVGGEFNTTTSVSNLGLKHVAQYDTAQDIWKPLGNGVDGPVNNLLLSPDSAKLTVSGQFSYRYLSPNNPKHSIGNAIWYIPNNTWVERSSLVVGQITVDDLETTNLLAGSILGAQTYRADLVISSNLNTSRSIFNNSITVSAGVTWINNNTNEANTIIAAYQNENITSNTTWTLVSIYDNKTDQWRPIDYFQGNVYTLATFQNWLYVGGQFSPIQERNQSASLAIYDLLNNYTNIGVQNVTDDNNNPGIVNVIKNHPDGKRVLIGGNFTKLGILDCDAVCVIDPSTRQWDQVALGLTGTVYDMVTSNQKITVVGDLQVQNQATSSAAIASVSDSANAWSLNLNTNQLPGTPITAVNSIDNEIIAAGTSSSNSSQFFIGSLNGQTYTSLISNLGQGTDISQLLLVPISSSSEQRYPSGTQNMLLAVGNLNINNFGNVSAALYDGNAWYPYLLTTQLNGQAGSIQKIIHTTDFNGMKAGRHYLSVAAVILISIAISTGILFTMSSAALLFLFRQHKNSVGPGDMPPWIPSNRFVDSLGLFGTGSLGTATIAATAAGASGAYGGGNTAKVSTTSVAGPSNTTSKSAFQYDDAGDMGIFSPTTTIVNNPTIPITAAVAAAGILSFDSMIASAKSNANSPIIDETHPKLFYAKYAFKAQEYGELSLDTGDTVVVTDTTDNIWWLGYKDGGANKPLSGVFPSNYVKP